MDIIPKKYDANWPLKLRTWWAGHYTIVLTLSTGFMGIISILRWKYELHRLLFETGRKGAIDLKLLYFWVSQWSAGNSVYGELSTVTASTYPPASHVILWPFLGWLNFTSALWLWAFTMMGALTWLIIIVAVKASLKRF